MDIKDVSSILVEIELAIGHLATKIVEMPRLICLGKPPEEYLAKARNLLEIAVTNILMAVEPEEKSNG